MSSRRIITLAAAVVLAAGAFAPLVARGDHLTGGAFAAVWTADVADEAAAGQTAEQETTRAADDAGFAITVMEDCCAAPNPEWHRFSTENILPMFAEVSSSKAVFG